MPESRDLTDKELVKQTLEPLIKKPVSVATKRTSTQDEDDSSALPNYLKSAAPEVKLEIEKLVDSVFHNGLAKAAKKAKSAGSFILDAFHDALADKLYEELKQRKLI